MYVYPSGVQKEVKNAYIWQWIDVTSLTLDKSSISLTSVWQTEQITATIVPAWTPITWSSSNTNIATVSSSWLVTCVTPWECTITASAFWVTADCRVTWPLSEYVLLSLGWDTNKYSELTLSWDSCVINNTTNWMWKVTTTDHFWLHYKEFSQRIVWFEISMAPTLSSSSYEHIEFCIFTNSSEINSSNVRRPLNWFWFSQESKTYSWSTTWKVSASQFVGWAATNFLNQNKSDSATTWTWTWELINWVWNISVVLANGQSWSATVTPDVANQNLYAIWFESGRWYTWTSGYFYSAKVKLA